MKITQPYQLTWLSVFLLTTALTQAQGIDFSKTELLTQQLAPDFYTLSGSAGVDPGHPEGAGGRIGVLVGPEGVFMVDATYAPLGDKVMAAIRKLSPAPIRFLVDTHSHPKVPGGQTPLPVGLGTSADRFVNEMYDELRGE